MSWAVTVLLSLLMMLGFFLMLYSAARFIQSKKFFSFIPKAIVETVRPKEERFKGQYVLG
ncbi:MAG: hypothetical protein IJS52_02020 [Bacilli bacterium]|nr:hypothetical protein [Bacilli bacterium]